MKSVLCHILVLFLLTVSAGGAASQVKIDDVSRLNETAVSAIKKPVSEQDIQQAVRDALASGKRISIAGRRHSQGGHIMSDDAIVLDMTSFNKIIGLNEDKTVLSVQSGATWAQIQDFLNKEDLAVKVQQSSNIFTVGGSLSANIHGRDPRFGPIIETVRSFRLVKADGAVVTVNRTENPELFSLVIGGYGLFGVITDVDLNVTSNSVLQKSVEEMNCMEYPAYLRDTVLHDEKIELHYVRPDITSKNLMESCAVTSWRRIADKPESLEPLEQEKLVSISKWLMDVSRKNDWGKDFRWFMQDSFLDTPGKVEVITRNNAMRPPVEFLDYQSSTDTDILQEYFIPLEAAAGFMADLKAIIVREDINILSITLRYVRADRESFLPYSARDTLAFVLYINHGRDENSVEKARSWTQKLMDSALDRGGSWYLTYAAYAKPEQIRKAYPALDRFFEKKREYDPAGLFMNKFYEQYHHE